MKKILLVAAVAGLSLVSCKKDYTCECTATSTYAGYTSQTSSASTGKMKKKDAETKCNSGDQSVNSVYLDPNTGNPTNYTIVWDCNIK